MKINFNNLDHRQLQSSVTAEKYALHASVSQLLGLSQMAIHHEIILPGHRASAKHFHTQKEEFILVIDGEVTAHLVNGEDVLLQKGDALGFKPGVQYAHHIENHSHQPAQLLVISSNLSVDDVVYV